MTVRTLIGYSKDDRFSQDQFIKFYELAQNHEMKVVSSKHMPSIGGIPKQNSEKIDDSLLVVFGGDGTMLRALKHHPSMRTIGINCGSFGFLCEFEADEIEQAINFILHEKWIKETTNTIRSQYNGESHVGINECVISGADTGRPVDLRVLVDGVTMFESRCDGLIISTPNGSTAYNFAAGGAILSPSLPSISITPIAPFLTLDRSVVLNCEKEIEVINLERNRRCLVFYDGVTKHVLNPGEQFKLVSNEDKAIFLRRKGSFSRRMSQKIANRYPIR